MRKFFNYFWIFEKYKNLKPKRDDPFLYWVPYFYSVIKHGVDNGYSKEGILKTCNDEIYNSVGDRRTRYKLYDDLVSFINEYIIEKEKRETEAVIIQEEEELFIV